MHHVFLSYSRADREWVTELQRRVEGAGVPTWIDTRDIPISVRWIDEAKKNIADSTVFVRCGSADYETSEACQTEDVEADQADVAVLRFTVGAPLDACAGQVVEVHRLNDTPPLRLVRASRATARTWEERGRPKSLLADRAPLSQLRRWNIHPDAAEWWRRSRDRQRRRRLLVLSAVGLVMASALVALTVSTTLVSVRRVNDHIAADVGQSDTALSADNKDPYALLRRAATLDATDDALNENVVQSALSEHLPADVVASPHHPIVAFDPRQHPDHISVVDGAGKSSDLPLRGAASQNQVTATGPAGAPPAGPNEVVLDLDAATVDVLAVGTLQRKLAVPRSSTAAALSPNRRWIAVAAGPVVDVYDLSSGLLRDRLVGARTALMDVRWSTDGKDVWAAEPDRVLRWRWTTGALLIDDPETEFAGLLPATDDGHLWTLTSNGRLDRVELATGRTVDSIDSHRKVLFARGDGSVVVEVGNGQLTVINLNGRTLHEIEVPDCDPGTPAIVGDKLAVPCSRGDLVVVRLATGQVEKRITVADDGASSVTSSPAGLVVTSWDGTVTILDIRTGAFTPIGQIQAHPYATGAAVAPDGQAVLPVGLGTGILTSTAVFNRDGPGWNKQVFARVSLLDLDSPSPAAAAGAAAFSTDGSTMAIGYIDGTIVMSNRVEPLPVHEVRDVAGRARDAITVGDKLIVATNEGVLQELDWRTDLATYQGAVAEARSRLAAAHSAGLSD